MPSDTLASAALWVADGGPSGTARRCSACRRLASSRARRDVRRATASLQDKKPRLRSVAARRCWPGRPIRQAVAPSARLAARPLRAYPARLPARGRPKRQAASLLTQRGRPKQVGGEIPCHFTTLTTAIYHWQDLRACLRKYDAAVTQRRQGRADPVEPAMARLPESKRLVLKYPGVVAWYTAYKMELFYQHVLQYEDGQGIFEWGAGGIMHLHSINFGSKMPPRGPSALLRARLGRRRRENCRPVCAGTRGVLD